MLGRFLHDIQSSHGPLHVLQMDLIPKVRVAMLTMISKEVTDLVIRGQFETALPIAMDAVQKAQALYWPREPIRMVPCYLLAVKVTRSRDEIRYSGEFLVVVSLFTVVMIYAGQSGVE